MASNNNYAVATWADVMTNKPGRGSNLAQLFNWDQRYHLFDYEKLNQLNIDYDSETQKAVTPFGRCTTEAASINQSTGSITPASYEDCRYLIPIKSNPLLIYSNNRCVNYIDLDFENMTKSMSESGNFQPLEVSIDNKYTLGVHNEWELTIPLILNTNSNSRLGAVSFVCNKRKLNGNWVEYSFTSNVVVKRTKSNENQYLLYIDITNTSTILPGTYRGSIAYLDAGLSGGGTIDNIEVDIWFSASVMMLGNNEGYGAQAANVFLEEENTTWSLNINNPPYYKTCEWIVDNLSKYICSNDTVLGSSGGNIDLNDTWHSWINSTPWLDKSKVYVVVTTSDGVNLRSNSCFYDAYIPATSSSGGGGSWHRPHGFFIDYEAWSYEWTFDPSGPDPEEIDDPPSGADGQSSTTEMNEDKTDTRCCPQCDWDPCGTYGG